MQDDLKERLQLIAELSGRLTSSEVASIAKQAADRIAALETTVVALSAAAQTRLDMVKALEAKLAEKDALLRECGEALAEYACHGGPDLPCIRSEDQCRTECGKIAGDALAKIKDATDAD